MLYVYAWKNFVSVLPCIFVQRVELKFLLFWGRGGGDGERVGGGIELQKINLALLFYYYNFKNTIIIIIIIIIKLYSHIKYISQRKQQ